MKTEKSLELIFLFILALSVTFMSGCGSNGDDDPNPQMNDDDDDSPSNTLSITSLGPDSPSELSNMEPVLIHFDYEVIEDDNVIILVAPYFEGEYLENNIRPVATVSPGTGNARTYFTMEPGESTVVDQLGFHIRNESNTVEYDVIYFDVDYTFTDGDDAMYVITTSPGAPETLDNDDDLVLYVTYKFSEITVQLNLDAELYFEGEQISEPYGIFTKSFAPDEDGNDLYGATTLTLNSNSSNDFQVDQVRFFASDGGDLIFEGFYDIEFTWNAD